MKKLFTILAAILVAGSMMAAWPVALPDDGVDFGNYAGWSTNAKTKNVAIYDDNEYLMAYSSGNDLAIAANGLQVGSTSNGACFYFYLSDEATVTVDLYSNGTGATVVLYSCGSTKPSAPTSNTYLSHDDMTSLGSVAIGTTKNVLKTITPNDNLSAGYYKIESPKRCFLKAIHVEYAGSDTRTAVNISNFTATNTTLTLGSLESTTTTVTNDQATWTASYTYESDNVEVATVNSNGVITAVADGTAHIKVTLNIDKEDANWKKGTVYTKSIEINVVDPNLFSEVFDLSANQYGWEATNDGSTYFQGEDYTPAIEGDITLSVEGKVRMWGTSTSSLRLYSDDTYGRGAITLDAASGYQIVAIILDGSSLTFNTTVGTYTESKGKWEGEETSVKLSKGGSTPQIKSITVKYIRVVVADIKMTAAQYATYYNATSAYIMPEGLEGITVDGVSDGVLSLNTTYNAGDVVPAGEALVLHATSTLSENTTFTLYAGTATSDKIAANILKGTSTADEMTTGNAGDVFYRLSQHEGQVGFYWGAADGAAFAPGANKAYLALPASAGAPIRFIIEGTEVATDIESVDAETVAQKVMINGQVFILRGEKLYDTVGRQVK